MMKRVLFAAIATMVMIGCDQLTEENDSNDNSNDNSNSNIPVDISYEGTDLSGDTYSAEAEVVEKDGTVTKTNLIIDEDGIRGTILDVECDDEVKVDIKVYDANGNLRWEGSDLVERENSGLYEEVNSDLFRIDDNGNLDTKESINDINGSNELIEDDVLEDVLSMLIGDYYDNGIDSSMINSIVTELTFTQSELILVEELVEIIYEANNNQGQFIEWESDTLYFQDYWTIGNQDIDTTETIGNDNGNQDVDTTETIGNDNGQIDTTDNSGNDDWDRDTTDNSGSDNGQIDSTDDWDIDTIWAGNDNGNDFDTTDVIHLGDDFIDTIWAGNDNGNDFDTTDAIELDDDVIDTLFWETHGNDNGNDFDTSEVIRIDNSLIDTMWIDSNGVAHI